MKYDREDDVPTLILQQNSKKDISVLLVLLLTGSRYEYMIISIKCSKKKKHILLLKTNFHH